MEKADALFYLGNAASIFCFENTGKLQQLF